MNNKNNKQIFNHKKISIVVPAYNAADTLEQLLASLYAQNYEGDWEIIIVNNKSTDGTARIVQIYQNKMPNLKLIEASEKKGSAYARNIGVQAATGDSVVFVDADDAVAPGWLPAMAKAFSQYDFIAARLDATRLNSVWTQSTRLCPQQNGLQRYMYPSFLPHASGSGLGVKRSVHEAIGGFDENLMRLQDTDYCWRIQLAGCELHFVPDAVVHYRFRESPTEMYNQARLWGEYNVLLYKKYRAYGMPVLSWQTGLNAWLSLLRSLPQLRHPQKRVRWLRRFFWRLGRLYGSIKYRVLGW